MSTNRRKFIQQLSSAGLLLATGGLSSLSWADDKKLRQLLTTTSAVPALATTGVNARVVVIGGGMAGATVAKYLRLWGGSGVAVTLIERNASYTSNIMSNLVLTGQRTIDSLKFKYDTLVSRYGVQLMQGDVTYIDPVNRAVELADGRRVAYDRLVIAPGIQFDTLPGLESPEAQAKVPHAWSAGEQTVQLRNMITAMPGGGVFVMNIPAKPYRCPPGPYERACVVADWLKRNRPGSKVIVLDANPGITAEPLTFSNAFNVIHKGVVEYHSGVSITNVDASRMKVSTNIGDIQGTVLNLIPPHRAGKVIAANGLADVSGRWTKVNVRSYETEIAPKIHVIGDASATTQPKAGHIANQEAKICADAIIRLLAGQQPDPAPVTNSACYSPITFDTASWLTAVFAYDPSSNSMVTVPGAGGEAHAPSKDNYEEMGKWFNTLMSDSFA